MELHDQTQSVNLILRRATGGIFFVYLISFILGSFGMNIPLIHGTAPFGLLFSVFVVIIAALNLVLDFDFIAQGKPKYMEWYSAFGQMVMLVWLYLKFAAPRQAATASLISCYNFATSSIVIPGNPAKAGINERGGDIFFTLASVPSRELIPVRFKRKLLAW